ncbi:hypothetical protein BDV35DRAFT_390139 [Aspergillus flavus]|uniref:F-box domain-containing protein n=1 Tax=Aspergillus flavus TaxID=5059 RepID=A0A5N6H5D5_ASPFL|nr:hypothetical protein BDV35DRAFT_390139 [Aspergillus flavus]
MNFDIGPDEIYWDDENLRPQPGLYTKHQLQQMPFVERLDWHCVYRVITMVLHNTCNNTYRVFGVAASMAAVEGQVLEAVPWDEMLGAIGYPEEDRDRLVQAIGLDQFNDTGTHGLVGYHLHDSCWELLTHHTIGEAARQSLVLVVRNLKELPADPWEYIDGMCPVEDPSNIKRVQSLIKRARIRTRARFHIGGRVNRQHNRLCYLPVEILCRVMDYLSPDDVEVVQVAMKYYLGDAYWRTRVTISRFPEVKSIWHETLDWQFLCLELEWLWETDDLAFDDMFSTG